MVLFNRSFIGLFMESGMQHRMGWYAHVMKVIPVVGMLALIACDISNPDLIDIEPPVIAIQSPQHGEVISLGAGTPYKSITITADVTDDEKVSRVTCYANGASLGKRLAAPYTWTYLVSGNDEGNHTILVEAEDNSENVRARQVIITVEFIYEIEYVVWSAGDSTQITYLDQTGKYQSVEFVYDEPRTVRGNTWQLAFEARRGSTLSVFAQCRGGKYSQTKALVYVYVYIFVDGGSPKIYRGAHADNGECACADLPADCTCLASAILKL
jgi:hypothetical protein